jgi:nucleotide-binding universal stress UspA family protein
MHVLHFIGVVADTGSEAVSRALYMIEDWGDEDNWRIAGGAVAEDGELYSTNEGRWSPEDWLGSPDKVRDEIRKDIAEKLDLNPKTDGTRAIDDAIAAADLRARSAARSVVDAVGSIEAFDPFRDNYRAGEYDEFGVTHFDDELAGRRWLVLIDMHT